MSDLSDFYLSWDAAKGDFTNLFRDGGRHCYTNNVPLNPANLALALLSSQTSGLNNILYQQKKKGTSAKIIRSRRYSELYLQVLMKKLSKNQMLQNRRMCSALLPSPLPRYINCFLDINLFKFDGNE